MAATRAADERLGPLFVRYGAATLQAAFADLHDQSEAEMRSALRTLPPGVYMGEDWLDDDAAGGGPVPVRVRIEVKGDRATFDFSATGDAVPGPLNATPFTAAASVFNAVKAIAGPAIQPNAGCARPLEIITRPGSLLNPPPDKPVVGGNHETSQRIVDAIVKALAPALSERLTAGCSTTSGLLLFSGRDPRSGHWTTLYEVHGGGEGARHDRDGVPVMRPHMSNVMNTPAEVIEANYPIMVDRQAIRRGSGGRGRHRGGDGQVRIYRVVGPEVWLTTMVERCVVPPYGLCGGGDGAPFRITLERASGETTQLSGKTHVRLAAGDRVVMETSGGGGFGPAPA
jgi:N-methylhydantoinase B